MHEALSVLSLCFFPFSQALFCCLPLCDFFRGKIKPILEPHCHHYGNVNLSYIYSNHFISMLKYDLPNQDAINCHKQLMHSNIKRAHVSNSLIRNYFCSNNFQFQCLLDGGSVLERLCECRCDQYMGLCWSGGGGGIGRNTHLLVFIGASGINLLCREVTIN